MPQAVDVVAFVLLAVVLLAAAVSDARTHRIPNRLTYGGILAGLLFWAMAGLLTGGMSGVGEGLGHALLGCAAGYVPMAIIFAAGGLGGGDVKLMAAAGALGASWQFVLATAIYAFVVMFLLALGIMIRQGIFVRTLRRIGNAALVAVARVKPDLPSDTPQVPFAVAVCVGGCLAGVEYLLKVRLPWTHLGP